MGWMGCPNWGEEAIGTGGMRGDPDWTGRRVVTRYSFLLLVSIFLSASSSFLFSTSSSLFLRHTYHFPLPSLCSPAPAKGNHHRSTLITHRSCILSLCLLLLPRPASPLPLRFPSSLDGYDLSGVGSFFLCAFHSPPPLFVPTTGSRAVRLQLAASLRLS